MTIQHMPTGGAVWLHGASEIGIYRHLGLGKWHKPRCSPILKNYGLCFYLRTCLCWRLRYSTALLANR